MSTGKLLPMSPKIVTPPSSDLGGISRDCGLLYPKTEALCSTKTVSQELEVNDKLIPYFRALTLENRNKTGDNFRNVCRFRRIKLETNSEGSSHMKGGNFC